MDRDTTYTAFVGEKLLASGALDEVLAALKPQFDRDAGALFLIFEDQTGRQVDFDLRGTLEEVRARYRPAPARVGPGRPKLGVIAREVSLLPRHWEWLEQQPSGASGAIRRLVDEARKRNPGEQQARSAIAAAGRFLSAMAGNLPGYEEASRALYARNRKRFHVLTREWPRDIRLHARHLVRGAL
ncbi:MAG TPA: DUF2239 family protein [Candidatus Acidoferrales bacterium]|nr:DUF2239 family protein [Candidatus Acidoferrales bacterium]